MEPFDDLWLTAWLRRAQRRAAFPRRRPEGHQVGSARARVHASVETIDDPWPSAELRRVRHRAATPPQRSEEHVIREARAHDHASEETRWRPLTRVRAPKSSGSSCRVAPELRRAPKRTSARPRDASMSAVQRLPRRRAAPKDEAPLRPKPTDPRGTHLRAVGPPPRPEGRGDTPRAHIRGPRDLSADTFSASTSRRTPQRGGRIRRGPADPSSNVKTARATRRPPRRAVSSPRGPGNTPAPNQSLSLTAPKSSMASR